MVFALSDMYINCPDFIDGREIPSVYSYEGGNVSPALQWGNLPQGTRSLAVFCHDPDAPVVSPTGNYGFVHWLLYNIPPEIAGIPQRCDRYAKGFNDFKSTGYGGPRPPAGHGEHRYYFWLLALDLEPMIQDGLTLPDFLEKTEPHILGMNRLTGLYHTA